MENKKSLFAILTVALVLGLTACPNDISLGNRDNDEGGGSGGIVNNDAYGTATLTITFAQITDAAPSITGPTLYRVNNGGPTSATLTVTSPSQYASISWRVQDTNVTGTDSSFILSAGNAAYNYIGEHFVTVSVMKGGAPYNKTVSFKVAY